MASVKICVTGPESSGKSTLAYSLSQHFGLSLVKEQARSYLNNLGRKHHFSDLENIAVLQLKAEKDAKKNRDLLVCDTDLITIKIWAEDKYQTEILFVEKHIKNNLADLYLLCYPDLPWQYDKLREDENRRLELFEKYKAELDKLDANFVTIKGKGLERELSAISQVQKFLET